MSLYRVTVDGQQYEVDVEDPRARPVKATIGSATYSVDLRSNPQSHQESLEATPATAPTPSPESSSQSTDPDKLTAPIPGAVASVSVKSGQTVKRGEELLTLEAMKMLNVIRSPRNGVIEAVHVTDGGQVSQGDPLITFAGK